MRRDQKRIYALDTINGPLVSCRVAARNDLSCASVVPDTCRRFEKIECADAWGPSKLKIVRQNYARQINAMDDDELERFVDDWITSKKKTYFAVEKFSGPSDLGRDVVGYYDERRHDGEWDNYQCKQLTAHLTAPDAMRELAKIFYHSAEGAYSLPARYVFVAPRSVARTVRYLISRPSEFREEMKLKWDEICAEKIVDGKRVPLDDRLKGLIDRFDFSNVDALDAAKILKDPDVKSVLVAWFDEDPGEAPRGEVPPEIQVEETPFVKQLVDVYSERAGVAFPGVAAVMAHVDFGEHLRHQRVRFFDAASFKRYYRDNTPAEYVTNFEEDIYGGVIDTYRKTHADTLDRVTEVMAQAAHVHPSGVLAKYARVSVKQGVCHHFANEGRLPWKL